VAPSSKLLVLHQKMRSLPVYLITSKRIYKRRETPPWRTSIPVTTIPSRKTLTNEGRKEQEGAGRKKRQKTQKTK